MRRQLARMQAMGRSLLLQREMALRGRWWAGLAWQRIQEQMPPARPCADPRLSPPPPRWVLEHLEVWKSLILVTEAQLAAVEATLAAAAPKELFKGEGEISHELIARELLDPQRFKNSRQVGNASASSGPSGYFGLCPSASSPSAKLRVLSLSKRQR